MKKEAAPLYIAQNYTNSTGRKTGFHLTPPVFAVMH